MSKYLTPEQIDILLNEELTDESENEETFQEQLSDLSDAEAEISDHDTESEEEPASDAENNSLEETDRSSHAFSCHVLHSASNTKMMSRYTFLENLGYALVAPHVQVRRSSANLSRELKGMMDKFLQEIGVELPEDISTAENSSGQPSPNKRLKKSRCHLCPRKKDSNTPRVCSKCQKNVCRVHSVDIKICDNCK